VGLALVELGLILSTGGKVGCVIVMFPMVGHSGFSIGGAGVDSEHGWEGGLCLI
jgi:hypothetical protein